MSEIKSEKILVKDIFGNMWFRIPEYQRPYVWGYEEVNDLLDDLTFAMQEKPDSEYFLGSFVFQAKAANPQLGQEFDENDLLDGQQRMTTLLLLLAVIRDLTTDEEAKEDCQKCIYQKSSKFKKIPERTRLVFSIREDVEKFLDKFIKVVGGTNLIDELESVRKSTADISSRNMAAAILEIRRFFEKYEVNSEDLLAFLLNNVLLIFVATEDLEDAFRLFMILNDRGVPLRNSDILKSINLGEIELESEKKKFAELWENAESELGDDFDRFLNHIRTILVKEKARLNLLQEFESKIYSSKDKGKSSAETKQPLLKKGKDTFLVLERYLDIYTKLFSGNNYDFTNSFIFDNLIQVMLTGLQSTDWIPPLLRYYDKFGEKQIHEFLVALDNKFSADWICQYAPTVRIDAMNNVIKEIDQASTVGALFESGCFDIDRHPFSHMVMGDVYGRRFARYVLLKLDYLYKNHAQKMDFSTLSVEHILPQNPDAGSQWVKDFTQEQRKEMTHKLGNLVLITRRKNASQGRRDYQDKKTRYFEQNVDTCPNSLRILNKYSSWTPDSFQENHNLVLKKLNAHYGL
ncbi:DUF262 domain-containing protein [Leptolyngbya sp. KIOST-1]|uniref:DUF262 domain-containing protein n=1 Tax=Leptolyngbya sp. KIOST-1 TaxID=1229172 RepID=UPI00056704B0|nr:DUF262 domain-containing protein [Leptolyngbya sp. KIOST-1]